MNSTLRTKTYTSPRHKLLRFFEKSRDQWKAKTRTAKAKTKRLANRVRFLEQSRARWKQRARQLEADLAETNKQKRALEQENQKLRNAPAVAVRPAPERADFQVTSPRQHYSLGQVLRFVSLVLSAATSLRAAGKALALELSQWSLALPSPSWSTGRLWLLRLGYYKLTRPKVHAADWVWIVDHTIQLGATKCLLILGVRLAALPPVGHALSHEAVEPLALVPVTHSNGTVVAQQLEAVVEVTGVPREIIGDYGSDLKSGVEKFCAAHPETSSIYDIKHKTAAVLKHLLESDEVWRAFTQQAVQTRLRLQQTALAALQPPGLRRQARYMNLERLVAWGRQLLAYVEAPLADPQPRLDAALVEAQLGWLCAFRQPLDEWAELFELVSTTESVVRQDGLSAETALKLAARLPERASTERVGWVRAELLAFVAQEVAHARPGERLVGSSEVIESVFGKLKYLERDQAASGFTGLVLSVCATVSTSTQEVVRTALSAVPTKEVLGWCKKNLGPSIQAQRRAILALPDRVEQKADRLLAPA